MAEKKEKQEVRAARSEYGAFVESLKERIRTAQGRAVRAVNTELVELYWTIGREILEKQQSAGWGDDVIGQIASDLKADGFGRGFYRSNLFYMRKFAQLWPEFQFVQSLIGQISWTQHIRLMDSFSGETDTYLFYASKSAQNNWSVRFLEAQIALKLHTRQGKSINNFSQVLLLADAEQANELIKDSYVFDFLDLEEKAKERDLENALTANVRNFLLELGQGFALYGQQMPLKVGDQDFYLDLVFYHHTMKRFVVIDLKMGAFTPEAAGKMNFYLTAVDKNICIDGDKESVGIILCTEYNQDVGGVSLERIASPIAVSTWAETGTSNNDMTPEEIRELEQIKAQLVECVKTYRIGH
jgi:predicted nuclease of restriction endonuclease-like (RecB) superfamily